MPRVLRCGWLFGGLMLGLACGTEQPTAPRAVPVPPTITESPQPPLSSANPSGPMYSAALSMTPFAVLRADSQYLLYDNGVFGLRYDAFAHVYLGTY